MSGFVGSLRGLEDNSGNAGQPYRRNSLALSLHSNLAAFPVPNNQEISPFHVVDSARRRFSNVSDVVSRKISHTIRWRTVSASIELTVSQVIISFTYKLKHFFLFNIKDKIKN